MRQSYLCHIAKKKEKTALVHTVHRLQAKMLMYFIHDFFIRKMNIKGTLGFNHQNFYFYTELHKYVLQNFNTVDKSIMTLRHIPHKFFYTTAK